MSRPNAKPYFAALLFSIDLLVLGAAITFRDSGASVPPIAGLRASQPIPEPSAQRDGMVGVASWYGAHWQGRKTASGTRYDVRKLTAAHRSLPLNTHVRVTNLENGRSVIVLINDRGPYVDGRVIDLSTAAARHLGMIKEGIVPVELDIVAPTKSET